MRVGEGWGMGQYPVKLVQPVALATGEVLTFSRLVAPPFVPYPGLGLKADWTEQHRLMVEQVTWDDREERFEVRLEAAGGEGTPAEEVVRARARTGWKVDEEAGAALREVNERAPRATLDRH